MLIRSIVIRDRGRGKQSKRHREPRGRTRSVLRLPDPMLARSGPIPTGRGWLFEPKLDGFRCLLCTHDGQRWDMTRSCRNSPAHSHLDVQLDGKLVAPR